MYKCEILADSISSRRNRLTTFCVTYPRFIHSEFLTHSMLVRNSESSRARPVQKNIDDVRTNPFIPEAFGKNQPGMQFNDILDPHANEMATEEWLAGKDYAAYVADQLAKLEVHKSYANRVIEPYKWHTALYSATDWDNFWALRTHKDAQKEFQIIALMMLEAYQNNEPKHLSSVEWHLPFLNAEEIQQAWSDRDFWKKVSIGRCARVSYLTHHGVREPEADVELYDRLLERGHMSPFGHIARPFNPTENRLVEEFEDAIRYKHEVNGGPQSFIDRMVRNLQYCAQYRGWWQARADIPNESNYALYSA